jgi:hypothetical protein
VARAQRRAALGVGGRAAVPGARASGEESKGVGKGLVSASRAAARGLVAVRRLRCGGGCCGGAAASARRVRPAERPSRESSFVTSAGARALGGGAEGGVRASASRFEPRKSCSSEGSLFFASEVFLRKSQRRLRGQARGQAHTTSIEMRYNRQRGGGGGGGGLSARGPSRARGPPCGAAGGGAGGAGGRVSFCCCCECFFFLCIKFRFYDRIFYAMCAVVRFIPLSVGCARPNQRRLPIRLGIYRASRATYSVRANRQRHTHLHTRSH